MASRPFANVVRRALADPYDRLLARSMGTDDPDAILAQIDYHWEVIGTGVASVGFI